MTRNLCGKIATYAFLLLSISACTSSQDKIANSPSNMVLPVAPYQNSAITLVSPNGKNTKAATFQRFSGELTVKKDSPSALKFSIQTNSIATSDKKLVSVLEGKDFFDTAKFPTAEFQSTDIKKNEAPDAQPNSYLVDGNLDIRGQKIKMSVPASLEISDKEISMMIQLSLTNKDWIENMKTSPDAFFTEKMDVVAKLVFPKPVKDNPTEPVAVETKKTAVAAENPKDVGVPAKEKKAEPHKNVTKDSTERKGN